MRCTACGYIVNADDTSHNILLDDIRAWINYVLHQHVAKGGTATHLNRNPNCPPCPACGANHPWENVLN